jgi:hypothetical protein
VYIAPASLTQAEALVATPAAWKRISDPTADLGSDLFQGQVALLLLPGDGAPQIWMGIAFTPNGTLAGVGSGPPPKGSLVIAPGIRRAPGSYAAGAVPVQLIKPQAVCGLVLSAYGVPALLNDRRAF